ncbi:hypothetical protein BGZ93_006965 [Podila epicladia]|nr:hypothetical protein BGZ93_006965 [Podila epicladia]
MPWFSEYPVRYAFLGGDSAVPTVSKRLTPGFDRYWLLLKLDADESLLRPSNDQQLRGLIDQIERIGVIELWFV